MQLILIHGALGSGAQMMPLATQLGARFETHVLELEGHGDTPSPHTHFSIDQFAEQLRHFIATKSLAPARIFGYSMGGYVALRLASQQPDLIASIATLAPSSIGRRRARARNEPARSVNDSRQGPEVRRCAGATTREERRMGTDARRTPSS
jgi:pimeloyl-ACP methyl ester carboxylesterase